MITHATLLYKKHINNVLEHKQMTYTTNDTIYDDKVVKLTSEIITTPVDITIPQIFIKNSELQLDDTVQYTKTRYSDKFYFYKNDTIIGQSLRWYGEYTELEIQLFRNFIDKNTVVYDIGANIGVHTVALARIAQRVYAWEPNNKNLELLYKNCQGLDNVEIFTEACSDKNDTMFVEDFDTTKPGNYGEMRMLNEGQACVSVKIDDLEIYAPEFMKIDVEGHELQVLLGAKETIKDHEPIIFYEAHGTELDLIYDLLADELKYHLYWYPCPNYNPNNFKNESRNMFGNGGVCNILAMPQSHKKIGNLLPVLDRDDTIQKATQRYLDTMKEQS